MAARKLSVVLKDVSPWHRILVGRSEDNEVLVYLAVRNDEKPLSWMHQAVSAKEMDLMERAYRAMGGGTDAE